MLSCLQSTEKQPRSRDFRFGDKGGWVRQTEVAHPVSPLITVSRLPVTYEFEQFLFLFRMSSTGDHEALVSKLETRLSELEAELAIEREARKKLEAEVQALRGRPIGRFCQRECSICLTWLTSKPRGVLGCGHVFHTDCVLPWLHSRGLCPICRDRWNPAPEYAKRCSE